MHLVSGGPSRNYPRQKEGKKRLNAACPPSYSKRLERLWLTLPYTMTTQLAWKFMHVQTAPEGI